MNIELDIKGSEDYLNIVGGFIRHVFFSKKKVFKVIGMRSTFLDTQEEVHISTIFGTELPQTVLLKLNTLDLSRLEEFVVGDIGDEKITNVNKEFKNNGLEISVRDYSDEILEISIIGNVKILKSTDLAPIIGECPEFNIFESIANRDLFLKLYVRYGYGYFNEEENLQSLGGDSGITVGTLNKSDCKFGYSVSNSGTPKLILNVEDSIDKSVISKVVSNALSEIMQTLSKV